MSLPVTENSESTPAIMSSKVDSDEQYKAEIDGPVSEIPLPETIVNNDAEPISEHLDAETSSNIEATTLNSDGDLRIDENGNIPVGVPSNVTKDVEVMNSDPPVNSNQNMMSGDEGSVKSIELSESQSLNENEPTKADARSMDVDLITEPHVQNKQNREQETVTSIVKLQDEVNW